MQFCVTQAVLQTDKYGGWMATRFATYSLNAFGGKENKDLEEPNLEK